MDPRHASTSLLHRGLRRIEQLADAAGQVGRRERLLEEWAALGEKAAADRVLVAVSGCVEHREVGPQLGEQLTERATARAGHDDVGHDKIDRSPGALNEVQRSRRCFGDQAVVPESLEGTDRERPEKRFVLDDGLLLLSDDMIALLT